MKRVVIATRGSQLALWQAEHTKARIAAVAPELAIDFNIITTSGDKILDVPLAKVGGKGLFVKEIEQALLDGAADLAVHSMKDVPAELAPGLALVAVSSREDPHDALCVRGGAGGGGGDDALAALPQGARVGTSSMRRQCQLLARRPDLEIRLLRGNVPTRIRKLDEGEFDAIVLAAAGLVRLGLGDRITQRLPIEASIPAVAQGVLGFETRAGDAAVIDLVRRAIHDPREALRVAAERAFLLRMGGSCQTPLAAHTVLDGGTLRIAGMCGMPDGSRILRAQIAEAAAGEAQAAALGVRLADALLAQGAGEILAATK